LAMVNELNNTTAPASATKTFFFIFLIFFEINVCVNFDVFSSFCLHIRQNSKGKQLISKKIQILV